MHIVIEASLPCMVSCIEMVQQPHSKSLSECRISGNGSILCRSGMFQKFMQGFDREESVIIVSVVCCSAGNDLLYLQSLVCS